MSLSEAVGDGRLAGLVALRTRLANEIDQCDSSRDVAALSIRLMDVMEQIESLDSSSKDGSGEVATPLDGLMKKIAERRAKTS